MKRPAILLAVALGCRPAPAPPPTADVAPADAASVAASAPRVADAAPEPPLEEEARELNPTSEKVKIRLWVWPVDGAVSWGTKKLGDAGRTTPLEIERPRGSGPLDLVVRAPGFLPFHTRVLTDRDEKLTVRLVRVEDAPGLLGYRPPPPPR
jgi:hypothetical protein